MIITFNSTSIEDQILAQIQHMFLASTPPLAPYDYKYTLGIGMATVQIVIFMSQMLVNATQSLSVTDMVFGVRSQHEAEVLESAWEFLATGWQEIVNLRPAQLKSWNSIQYLIAYAIASLCSIAYYTSLTLLTASPSVSFLLIGANLLAPYKWVWRNTNFPSLVFSAAAVRLQAMVVGLASEIMLSIIVNQDRVDTDILLRYIMSGAVGWWVPSFFTAVLPCLATASYYVIEYPS